MNLRAGLVVVCLLLVVGLAVAQDSKAMRKGEGDFGASPGHGKGSWYSSLGIGLGLPYVDGYDFLPGPSVSFAMGFDMDWLLPELEVAYQSNRLDDNTAQGDLYRLMGNFRFSPWGVERPRMLFDLGAGYGWADLKGPGWESDAGMVYQVGISLVSADFGKHRIPVELRYRWFQVELLEETVQVHLLTLGFWGMSR